MYYSELPANQLLVACAKYLKERELYLANKRDSYITNKMKQSTWFGFGKPHTRENVIRQLENSGKYSDYNIINLEGKYWANKIEQLKSLCLMSEDKNIKIDSEIAHLLVDCWDNK